MSEQSEFDPVAASRRLERSGFTRPQARSLVREMVNVRVSIPPQTNLRERITSIDRALAGSGRAGAADEEPAHDALHLTGIGVGIAVLAFCAGVAVSLFFDWALQ